MKKSHVVDHYFDNFELNEKGGSDQKVKGRFFSEQYGSKIGCIGSAETKLEPHKVHKPCY
jgi:hypothetical protein